MRPLRVALPLIGSGTNDDPYRVEAPTFDGLSADYDRGIALVNVHTLDDGQRRELAALAKGTIKHQTIELGDLTGADPAKVREVFAQTHQEWFDRR